MHAGASPVYLDEALESISLAQTVRPAQIVVVKDGPLTKQLEECLAKWVGKLGKTIELVGLPRNVGLAEALNSGLERCRFELVARMDADDIALPHRFEQQYAFMQDNLEIAVCSCWLEEFDEKSEFAIRKLPTSPDDLKAFAYRRSPIAHPAAMLRRSVVIGAGGYPLFRKSQDYALWAKLLVDGHRLANLPLVLQRMRVTQMFSDGRGAQHLANEWRMFMYQKQIGFIGWYELLRNVAVRCILRMSPPAIRRLLYKFGRT